jgi:hypothetical protein
MAADIASQVSGTVQYDQSLSPWGAAITLLYYHPTFSFSGSARKSSTFASRLPAGTRDLLEQVGEHTKLRLASSPSRLPQQAVQLVIRIEPAWKECAIILAVSLEASCHVMRAAMLRQPGEQGTPRRIGIVAEEQAPQNLQITRCDSGLCTRESLAVHRLDSEDREGGAKVV